MSDITQILAAIERGEPDAAEKLIPLVYEQLRSIARQKMAGEKPGHTLQPTALAHEAWLRLGVAKGTHWDSRGHFFAAAAEAMRRILIDAARRKKRIKHGGDLERVDIENVQIPEAGLMEPYDLLDVNDALDKLEKDNPKAAAVVKHRYFLGLTNEETAESVGISPEKAKRLWVFARAMLLESLKEGSSKRGVK